MEASSDLGHLAAIECDSVDLHRPFPVGGVVLGLSDKELLTMFKDASKELEDPG